MELGSIGLCKVYRSRSSKPHPRGKGDVSRSSREVPLRRGKKGRITVSSWKESGWYNPLLEDTTGKTGESQGPLLGNTTVEERGRVKVVQSPFNVLWN